MGLAEVMFANFGTDFGAFLPGRYRAPVGRGTSRSLHAWASLPKVACPERTGRLLAVVSESAGISAMRPKHSSQEDTRTQDDHIAHDGRGQARDHDEAKPDQEREDQPPRFGSIGAAVDERA